MMVTMCPNSVDPRQCLLRWHQQPKTGKGLVEQVHLWYLANMIWCCFIGNIPVDGLQQQLSGLLDYIGLP